MKKLLNLSALIGFAYCTSFAQAPFNTIEYNDINKIKASVLLHGDFWWEPLSYSGKCEFPKGSGKQLFHSSSIWMSGYSNNHLHASAQLHRSGFDFWPGPLDGSGNLSYSTSQNWARIWKINRKTIDSFLKITNHDINNTPATILEWPAKNNPYAKGANGAKLTINTGMAPFVDVNGDGNYNPLQGDYPEIKGDQMLWWVFSDNGPTRSIPTGASLPLKIEFHACAYGLNDNTLIGNILYYDFKLINKSGNNYTNFRIGVQAMATLGDYRDNYAGFDSSYRLGYVYNAKTVDGDGYPYHYDSEPPIAGITLVRTPGDNLSKPRPAGSFMLFNNDYSVMGNPTSSEHYNNYIRSKWKDGTPLTNDFTGPNVASKGYGSGPATNYIFSGNPEIKTEWSECAANNTPGDRNLVIASNDYTFNAGSSTAFVFALVSTHLGSKHTCPDMAFYDIKQAANMAWKRFGFPLGVDNVPVAKSQLRIYPNPAQELIYIETTGAGELYIYDAIGRKIQTEYVRSQNRYEVNANLLPPGIYNAVYRSGENVTTGTFIKE